MIANLNLNNFYYSFGIKMWCRNIQKLKFTKNPFKLIRWKNHKTKISPKKKMSVIDKQFISKPPKKTLQNSARKKLVSIRSINNFELKLFSFELLKKILANIWTVFFSVSSLLGEHHRFWNDIEKIFYCRKQ